MTRLSLEILLSVKPPRYLELLPEATPRAPWMSDEDWRDHLLVVARGHRTRNLTALCIDDPAVEHQLRVYHAGAFLTPPTRFQPAQEVLFCGWQVEIAERQPLPS